MHEFVKVYVFTAATGVVAIPLPQQSNLVVWYEPCWGDLERFFKHCFKLAECDEASAEEIDEVEEFGDGADLVVASHYAEDVFEDFAFKRDHRSLHGFDDDGADLLES